MTKLTNDWAGYVRQAQRVVGPWSLAKAIALEARHRMTGEDRVILVLKALCEQSHAGLIAHMAGSLREDTERREQRQRIEAAMHEAERRNKARDKRQAKRKRSKR